MAQELVLVVDFGGQYNQLIARRVRENNVYCEIVPYTKALQVAKEKKPVGLIFTGGPASVYEEGAPSIDAEIFELNIPILGICYGAQLIAYVMGGDVSKAELREYGKVELNVESGTFLSTATDSDICWMSHGVQINTPPEGFSISATTNTCPVAAMENSGKKIYGVQFHPEVEHTPFGKKLIHNFLYDICKCTGEWTTEGYLEMGIENIRRTVGEDKSAIPPRSRTHPLWQKAYS
jgi:GMP synthase (glutamine-hydrolyzing), N-terminal domain or A subunit